MNIKKIFKNKTTNEIKEFNHKLNNQILLQLTIYALEDKEIEFDNLIKKDVNLMTGFGFSPEVYEAFLEDQQVSVELTNSDYDSFLEAAIDCLPTKYIKKVAENIKKEDYQSFLSQSIRYSKTAIIKKCIIRNKQDALSDLVDLGILTEKGILQTIFIYERKVLKEYIDDEILKNPILLHEAMENISFKNHDCMLGKETNENINIKKRGGFFYGNLITKVELIDALETANISNYKYKNDVIKNIINAFIVEISTLNNGNYIFDGKKEFEEYMLDNSNIRLYGPSTMNHFNDTIFEFINKDYFDMDEELDIKLLNNDIIKFKFSNWYKFDSKQESIIIEKRNEILTKELKQREYNQKLKI